MNIKHIFRLIKINHVLAKHRLDEFIQAPHLLYPLRLLGYVSPYRWTHTSQLSRGDRLCLALQELGPIFVKFGQLLSTRHDLLPDDIADALTKLQDKVAPFSSDLATKLIQQAYGKQSLNTIFTHIDYAPLASASIAQVHTAKLIDGDDVILKIVRPGIEQDIRHDIALLYILAGLAERYWSEGKRFTSHRCL